LHQSKNLGILRKRPLMFQKSTNITDSESVRKARFGLSRSTSRSQLICHTTSCAVLFSHNQSAGLYIKNLPNTLSGNDISAKGPFYLAQVEPIIDILLQVSPCASEEIPFISTILQIKPRTSQQWTRKSTHNSNLSRTQQTLQTELTV
jgi:hypothetical protein